MLRCAVEEYEITVTDKSSLMCKIEDTLIKSDFLSDNSDPDPDSDSDSDSLCGFGSSTSLYFGASDVSCSLPKGLLIFGGHQCESVPLGFT